MTKEKQGPTLGKVASTPQRKPHPAPVRMRDGELLAKRRAVAPQKNGERTATLVNGNEEEQIPVGKAALMTRERLERQGRAYLRLKVTDLVHFARAEHFPRSLLLKELRRAWPPQGGRPPIDSRVLHATFEQVLDFYECSRADAFRMTARHHQVSERRVRIAVAECAEQQDRS